MAATEPIVQDYIDRWIKYRDTTPEPARYMVLKSDLYNVRNGSPSAVYPMRLIHPDDEVMACVEHYFLSRAWVGNGIQPAWQMRSMTWIYNSGKEYGVTPRHNPSKPVTPPSAVQRKFQDKGVTDGEADLAAGGGSAPRISAPPLYY
jgi:hypothetical protein